MAASTDATQAIARSGVALALAALALIGLAAPKLTAAEVLDLEPGYPRRSAAAGLLLTYPAASPATVEVSGDSGLAALRRGRVNRSGEVLLVWHRDGPTLAISPAGAAPTDQGLVIPFLPDETSKYVAVPEAGESLRASLSDTGDHLTFQVQPLNRRGQPSGELYEVSEPTVVSLPNAALTLTPTHHQVVSVTRMPLWWAALAGVVALACFLAMGRLWQGLPLKLVMGEQDGVGTVEIDTLAASRRHRWWVCLARQALR